MAFKVGEGIYSQRLTSNSPKPSNEPFRHKNLDLLVMKSNVFFSKMSAQTFVTLENIFRLFPEENKMSLKSAIYM